MLAPWASILRTVQIRHSPDLLCAKIDAIQQSTLRSGIDLFVSTRTDVYLRALASGAGDAAVAEVIRKAALYRAG
jgi:hypothetical protein